MSFGDEEFLKSMETVIEQTARVAFPEHATHELSVSPETGTLCVTCGTTLVRVPTPEEVQELLDMFQPFAKKMMTND
jgi:hypothetical protein